MSNNHQTQKINTNRFNMVDLVYDIETKISLLSQIEQNANLQKSIILKDHRNQNEEEQQSEINQPMQMLNRRMMDILNKKQENPNERTQERLEKKRMDLHELQTGTRDADEIKREGSRKSGIQLRHFYNSINHNQGQQVRQFNIHNTSQLYNNSALQQPLQLAVISNSLSSSSSSKIVNKFNSIQLNYVDRIKTLSFKVTYLQQKLQQSQEEKRDVMESLETYKALYSRKQGEIEKQIESKLQQIKSTLIDKFAEECRMKYTEYINQLKQITNILNQERTKRKFYEDQNKLLKLEKENYQHMYKSLLNKQKHYLKIDIDKTKHQLNLTPLNHPQTCDYSHIQNKNLTTDTLIFGKDSFLEDNTKNNSQNKIDIDVHGEKLKHEKPLSKSKNKSLSKTKSLSQKEQRKSKGKQSKQKTSTDQRKSLQQSSVNNKKRQQKSNPQQQSIGQTMTTQELIPFLAKGIQQLKQRLRMN